MGKIESSLKLLTNNNLEIANKNLTQLLEEYKYKKKPIQVDFRKLVSWERCGERFTHRIHPYPAKLIQQIPVFFLSNDILSKKGDYVLDPFSGSGTVLLEAILQGRHAIGSDSNPLARLITSVKTSKVNRTTLESLLNNIENNLDSCTTSYKPEVVNMDYWFNKKAKNQLTKIYNCITSIPNKKYRDFFLLCLSATAKRVSYADPRLSVPVKLNKNRFEVDSKNYIAVSRKLSLLDGIDSLSVFREICEINIKRAESLSNELNLKKLKPKIKLFNDARKLMQVGKKVYDSSVQLVITSPPYAGAQKYIRSSSLCLGWTGLCKPHELRKYEDKNIGREHYVKHTYQELLITGISQADSLLAQIHKINPLRAHIAANYLLEMKDAIKEAYRVLKSGGYFVLVSSNNRICKFDFNTHVYLVKIAKDIGFQVTLELVDEIHSRGLMTKRNKTAGIINCEYIYLLKK
ncbi:DNA methyltransferase [Kangiella sp.]|uniref:DNA methyltransferase n=1 Tax=Kangiella sp. TaxID=1920245 RepID=UPI003A92FDF9